MQLKDLLRITPQQLRAFEAAARLQSVTRAAQALHVTQPTVSVQLRELATQIGQPLFETTGRQIRLTQAGLALQDTVHELTQCWQRYQSQVEELNGLMVGQLRVAAVTTAEYFVPDLLGPFAAAHPGVEIELAIENRDRVLDRLQRHVDDLTVMMMPPQDAAYTSVPFLDNPLVVIAPLNHVFAGKRIRLASLEQERWLMRELGSGTRMATEQYWQHMQFKARVAMNLGSNEAIKHAVGAGLGIAVLSQLAVTAGLTPTNTSKQKVASEQATFGQLAVLNVMGFPIKRRWYVVWRKDRVLSVAARQFISYLKTDASTAIALTH